LAPQVFGPPALLGWVGQKAEAMNLVRTSLDVHMPIWAHSCSYLIPICVGDKFGDHVSWPTGYVRAPIRPPALGRTAGQLRPLDLDRST
jgi:hypothetical protein